jgi:hypothetical protein
MHSTTNPKGQELQTPTDVATAGGENKVYAQRRYRIEAILWSIGMVIFIASCVIIHFHPQPYPFDIATTQAVQGLHLCARRLTQTPPASPRQRVLMIEDDTQ